jgi:hypothetical protein
MLIWMEVVSIEEWKKLTWLCLWESPFDLKGRFMHHLQYQKNPHLKMQHLWYKRGARNIFCDNNCHLQGVTKCICLMQTQFILIQSFFGWTTPQIFLIQGVISKRPDIIIRSGSVQVGTPFPRLL